MHRRRIRRAAVIAVVQKPQQIIPSRRGRRIFQSKIGTGGRMLLRVVVNEDRRTYHVITVYQTSKIAKFWRQP